MACSSACAQLSGSVALDSDYRARGVSLSDSKPAPRAALNYDAAGGAVYFGAALARVESAYGQRHVQATSYAGWVRHTVEFGLIHSHFAGASGQDYAEAYAGLLAERWNARIFYAPDYFGDRIRTLYAELNAHTMLMKRPGLRLFAHAGLLARIGGTPSSSPTRADLRVGAGYSLGDADLQLAWTGVSRGGPGQAFHGYGRRAAFVGSVSLAF